MFTVNECNLFLYGMCEHHKSDSFKAIVSSRDYHAIANIWFKLHVPDWDYLKLDDETLLYLMGKR